MYDFEFEDEYEHEIRHIRRGKKWEKIKYDPSKHYPNKHEAECLRRIMATSGLTKDEVRANATYRTELANASKEGVKAKRSATVKWCQDMIKYACKQTGLVPQHPETIKVLDEILSRVHKTPWWLGAKTPQAKKIVRDYAK